MWIREGCSQIVLKVAHSTGNSSTHHSTISVYWLIHAHYLIICSSTHHSTTSVYWLIQTHYLIIYHPSDGKSSTIYLHYRALLIRYSATSRVSVRNHTWSTCSPYRQALHLLSTTSWLYQCILLLAADNESSVPKSRFVSEVDDRVECVVWWGGGETCTDWHWSCKGRCLHALRGKSDNAKMIKL